MHSRDRVGNEIGRGGTLLWRGDRGAAHGTSMANEPALAHHPATLIARITEDLAALRQALAERPAPAPQAPSQPKLILTVEEAGELIGVSRTLMYLL